MNSELQEINEMLRTIRDCIRVAQPGHDRDRMQARFDRVIKRIAQVPDRVMAQARFDANGLSDGPQIAAVWRAEMESALSVWEQDA
jgi:hypothetical protein